MEGRLRDFIPAVSGQLGAMPVARNNTSAGNGNLKENITAEAITDALEGNGTRRNCTRAEHISTRSRLALFLNARVKEVPSELLRTTAYNVLAVTDSRSIAVFRGSTLALEKGLGVWSHSAKEISENRVLGPQARVVIFSLTG